MINIMNENNGVGLAANQVGLGLSLFVTTAVTSLYPEEPEKIIVNPQWTEISYSKKVKSPEGCLSFPGWIAPITRRNKIFAEWQDINGNFKSGLLMGWESIVFQHETDHILGKTMIDYLTDKQKQTLKKFYKEQ